MEAHKTFIVVQFQIAHILLPGDVCGKILLQKHQKAFE